MLRRTAFVSLWIVATLVATSVAVAAVRGVTGRVVDAPTPTLPTAAGLDTDVAAADSVVSDSDEDNDDPGSTGVPTTDDGATTSTNVTASGGGAATTQAPGTTSGSGTGSGGTTVATSPGPDDGGPASTTQPPTTTQAPATPTTLAPTTTTEAPTTTKAPEPKTTTYQLVGGWVRVETVPGTVLLLGAGPTPGFDMDLEEVGPEEVEAEFESATHKSSIKIKWSGGELTVDIDEEPQDAQDEDDDD